MAHLFADEGANVVLTARGKEKLDQVVEEINAKVGKAVGVVADTGSLDDCKTVFETALKEFNDLDILVNNAGLGEMWAIDETEDDWMNYILNINVGGPIRYTREALKHFFAEKPRGNHQRLFCKRQKTHLRRYLHRKQGGGGYPDKKYCHPPVRNQHPAAMPSLPGSLKPLRQPPGPPAPQPGGDKMLKYTDRYINTSLPATQPIDQANACLFLASDMGRCVKGQVIQVCNGAFL